MAHRRESNRIVAMRYSPKNIPGSGEGACVSLCSLFLLIVSSCHKHTFRTRRPDVIAPRLFASHT